jgi:hypothetical protein
MPATDTRIHVIMPADLVEKIDKRVGHRQRSRFMAEIAAREIARLELLDAAEEAAGSLPVGLVPEWDNSESAAKWVHDLRQECET